MSEDKIVKDDRDAEVPAQQLGSCSRCRKSITVQDHDCTPVKIESPYGTMIDYGNYVQPVEGAR